MISYTAISLTLGIMASSTMSHTSGKSDVVSRHSEAVAQCSLRGASVKMRGAWKETDSIIIMYARQGEFVKAAFHQPESNKLIRRKLDYFYSFDGENFFICKEESDCVGVAGTPAEYRHGIQSMIDTGFIKGHLTCYIE